MDTFHALTWVGIALCVLQSAVFSGLNLALFGLSALQLQVKAETGDQDAAKLMELRRDSNFLLTTILWGNVSTNVLLTLLSDSVLAGVSGFLFSTCLITFGGEIAPQAYFSRNALRMATLSRPLLKFWQMFLYPLAKPTAMILDAWLGPEGLEYSGESELRSLLKRHIAAPDSEVSRVEGVGALNFLALDDVLVSQEGEALDPESIVELEASGGAPVFPAFERSPEDPFLRQLRASGKRWVIITDPEGEPQRALDAHRFLRAALADDGPLDVRKFCHAPIVVRDIKTRLEAVLPEFNAERRRAGDDIIHKDVIVVWASERRVITGADLLGRLMRGIARPVAVEG